MFRGTVHVVDADGKATPVPRNRMAILKNAGDAVMLQSESSEEPARALLIACLLYTSPSPRDGLLSRMPSSA